MSTHRERSAAECTQDAIFLLQTRRLQLLDVPHDEDSEHFDFTDGIITRIKDADGDLKEPHETIELTQWMREDFSTSIGDAPCVVEFWETESVWLDRAEAEAWAKAHAYRWQYGWRVYSVPAKGYLVPLLRSQDVGGADEREKTTISG